MAEDHNKSFEQALLYDCYTDFDGLVNRNLDLESFKNKNKEEIYYTFITICGDSIIHAKDNGVGIIFLNMLDEG